MTGLLAWLGGALLRLTGLLVWLGGALLRLTGLLSGLGGALLRLTGLLAWLGGALLLRFRLGLGALLLLLRFRLGLGTLLLLRFRLSLGTLLLCRSRRGLPGFWFGLRFLLLFVLRDGRDNGPEKHKNGSRTDNSNDLHGHYLRCRHSGVCTPTASPAASCPAASAASASALVLCTVPAGWLGGE